MSLKQAGIMLFEIEGLLKRLQTLKKMPAEVIREENRLYEKLRKLFHKQFAKVMAKLKKEGLPSSDLQRKELLYPLVEMGEEYIDIVIEGTQEALQYGRRDMFNRLRKSGYLKVKKAKVIELPQKPILPPILEVEFFEFSPEILKMIRDKTFVASQATMDRIIGDIMENLSESYAQGLGIDDAASELDRVFTSMEDFELRRVARTEINQAQNKGAYFTEQELDVEYHKWNTSIDGRQRESHEELDTMQMQGKSFPYARRIHGSSGDAIFQGGRFDTDKSLNIS